ncbi:MAG TPA: DUF5996 family protein [Thermoanaerobaculia bacterium]|jgi:hypothetical protein
MTHPEHWPSLPLADWQPTLLTLHRWTQIAGKIRMTLSPKTNHWWHVPLYVSARGLTTSAIPYGTRTFTIEFDFIAHKLDIMSSDGGSREIALAPKSVAEFYREVMDALHALNIEVKIYTTPVEVEDTTPFEEDRHHASYDAEAVHRFWHVVRHSDRVLQQFRGKFIGKCSPVHFFWGSFDLAVTRFSGRTAPRHPGAPGVADVITTEAYSHEVSSAGWWPGGGAMDQPAYYSYAYPAPEGYSDRPVRPKEAYFSKELGEFLLPYEAVRVAASPEETLMEFLQSTYEAAADSAGWDRAALEAAG